MNRLRFAPSPTGFVHVGNARTALFNYLHAGKSEGKMVLRIEDTDVERSKKEYEENLIKDLKWLGIQWDEGPDTGGDFGPYRQSERNETYGKYARQLIENEHAYYCFCAPKEEGAESQPQTTATSCPCREMHPQHVQQRIQEGETPGIRFKVPRHMDVTFYDLVRDKVTFDSNLINDPVIVRGSGIPTYNFSVVIDDHLMGINLVVRGEDHLSNTARQVLIYQALDFNLPKFAHLSMVMGEDNQKLSKRHGSTSLVQFREEGYLPEALLNYLAMLGWAPSKSDQVIFTKEELLKSFNIKKVSKSAAIFDYQKLKWMNREHIRLLDDNVLAERIVPFLENAGFTFEKTPEIMKWIGKTAKVVSNYHYLLTEIAEDFKQFTQPDYEPELVESVKSGDESMKVISVLYDEVKNLPSPVDFAKVLEITKKIQKEHGIKGKGLYHPIRLALTGKESGIELKDFIPIIEEGSMLDFQPRVQAMTARFKVFI